MDEIPNASPRPASMPEPILSTFSRSGQSLFSVQEVRSLMNIEFERAARYEYPVCCILVQVDRIADVATYHGTEVKDHILNDMVELIRSQTRGAGGRPAGLFDRGSLAGHAAAHRTAGGGLHAAPPA